VLHLLVEPGVQKIDKNEFRHYSLCKLINRYLTTNILKENIMICNISEDPVLFITSCVMTGAVFLLTLSLFFLLFYSIMESEKFGNTTKLEEHIKEKKGKFKKYMSLIGFYVVGKKVLGVASLIFLITLTLVSLLMILTGERLIFSIVSLSLTFLYFVLYFDIKYLHRLYK